MSQTGHSFSRLSSESRRGESNLLWRTSFRRSSYQHNALPPDQTISQPWPYRQTAKPSHRNGLTARPNQLSMALPPDQTRQLSVAVPQDPRPRITCLWPYRQTKPAQSLTPYRQTRPLCGLIASSDRLTAESASHREKKKAGGRLDQGPAPNGAWRNSVDPLSPKPFHRRGSQCFIDAANPQWCLFLVQFGRTNLFWR